MTRTTSTVDPTRRAALAAGLLYLATFAFGIPSAFLLQPVLSDPTYIVGAGPDTLVLTGALFDLINALACIGTAVALFSVVRRQHEGLALGFMTIRIYEAAVIMVGVVSILAVVTLRQAGTAGADSDTLVTVGRSLVAVRDWTFVLGPGLAPAINAVLLGTLMYRSRLVPRLIPVLGLIGAPLLVSSTLGTMFGVNEPLSAWTAIATFPIFFWELFLGLRMTFTGFDRSAPIVAAAIAASAAPDVAGTPVAPAAEPMALLGVRADGAAG